MQCFVFSHCQTRAAIHFPLSTNPSFRQPLFPCQGHLVIQRLCGPLADIFTFSPLSPPRTIIFHNCPSYKPTKSSIFSFLTYLPQKAGYLVSVLPGSDPPFAGVAVDSSAPVVEDLSSPEVGSEHVWLLPQEFVEGFDQDEHGVVHQCRLCLRRKRMSLKIHNVREQI